MERVKVNVSKHTPHKMPTILPFNNVHSDFVLKKSNNSNRKKKKKQQTHWKLSIRHEIRHTHTHANIDIVAIVLIGCIISLSNLEQSNITSNRKLIHDPTQHTTHNSIQYIESEYSVHVHRASKTPSRHLTDIVGHQKYNAMYTMWTCLIYCP